MFEEYYNVEVLGNRPMNNTSVAMRAREQAWYQLEAIDPEVFPLGNDEKINLDQIITGYQELKMSVQSANRSKLAGVDKFLTRIDTALELFLSGNAVRIKKI